MSQVDTEKKIIVVSYCPGDDLTDDMYEIVGKPYHVQVFMGEYHLIKEHYEDGALDYIKDIKTFKTLEAALDYFGRFFLTNK